MGKPCVLLLGCMCVLGKVVVVIIVVGNVVVIVLVVLVVGGGGGAVVGLDVGKTENNSMSLSFRKSFNVKFNITDTYICELRSL